MRDVIILNDHIVIKETIGFAIFDEIPIEDHLAVIDFAKIIFNYLKMCRLNDRKNN